MDMNQKIAARMEVVSDKMRLPSDILAGAPILVITGQTELSIENYKGIVEYTGDFIRIQTRTGRIHITGRNLVIRCYTEDSMKVSGYVTRIEYC